MVNVLLPEPGDLMLVGEKVAVIPEGLPLTLRLKADLKVVEVVVKTETVVLLPARIVAAPAEVAKVNVAGTLTIRFTAEEIVFPPELARTDNG